MYLDALRFMEPETLFYETASELQVDVLNLTVTFAVDGALVEGHDILGERSCFIAEDVLDLAELLVQRGGASLSGSVVPGIVHLPVPVDVEAVPQTNDLHTAEKCTVDTGSEMKQI